MWSSSWVQTFSEFEERLGNCSARLYPSLPSPAIPLSLPLEGFGGNYFHPGYGPISVSLQCDDWEHPTDSPASPSVNEDGCRLVVAKTSIFGKQVSYQLEHKSGDLWLGWFFNDDYATMRRPVDCFRAEFRMDASGQPSAIGLDIRMEGEDVPITWFERS